MDTRVLLAKSTIDGICEVCNGFDKVCQSVLFAERNEGNMSFAEPEISPLQSFGLDDDDLQIGKEND